LRAQPWLQRDCNKNYQQKKSRPSCGNCKKIGHTKDTCWFLHGKPPKGRENRGNTVSAHNLKNTIEAAAPEHSPFSKEQIDMLQKLLQ